jgi:hypothetical protein
MLESSAALEGKMQKWEYCILEHVTHTKESKSSSKDVTKIAKAKIHYFEEGKLQKERLFKHIYPRGNEIEKAIAFLGGEGWELVESTSEETRRKTNTKYRFKRPLAE